MTVVNNSNQYLPGVIFIPSTLLITAITNAYPMVVTATVPSTGSNTYIVGQVVRLFVPYNYGMYQANNLQGKILAINGLDFSLDIDSRLFDTFVIPSSGEQPASFSPAGSRNTQFDNTTNQLGFQPLNNNGN